MRALTIAVFHCKASSISAWNCSDGLVRTLQYMGHRVIDCKNPRLHHMPIEILQAADVIVMSGAEWYDALLLERYGEEWNKLRAAKVCWFTETAHRDDRDFPYGLWPRYADFCYCPAKQDADEFGGEYLPFGVDTMIFTPQPVAKSVEVGFIGNIYPKRAEYCRNIAFPITRVQPLDDRNPQISYECLAQAYSGIRIFVNLPAYSRLLVTKVSEVMACRTMLITPLLDHPSAVGNMSLFEDGKHLVYYDPADPKGLGEKIAYYQAHPDHVDQIAEAGHREILRAHTLVHRLEKILGDIEQTGALRAAA
jgi:hypothetical protein